MKSSDSSKLSTNNPNTKQIEVGDTQVDVIFKDIKNVHLSVHPPTGRVRISAPRWMKLDAIRVYAISKIEWIKHHQRKFKAQARETPREYLDRESHYVWGIRYLLKVVWRNAPSSVELKHNHLILSVRPNTSKEKLKILVNKWYRMQLMEALPPLLARWEHELGVKAKRVIARRMKTLWGSCSHKTQSIRLNTDLAKKPTECLEYVLVHELAHLIEPSHNDRFIAIMDRYMPNWKHRRDQLNQLPASHEEWGY